MLRHKLTWSTLLSTAGILFVFSGCAATNNASQNPRPLGAGIESFRPPGNRALRRSSQFLPDSLAQRPDVESIAGPTKMLTLQESLALALLNNPKLRAYSWAVRATEARALQAGLPPNPQLAADLENYRADNAASGIGNAEATISLSQLVELGGDRRKRRRVAGLVRDLAEWDYEATRLDVLTSTTQNFAAVLAQQDRAALADSLLGQAMQFYRSVAARVEAGKVSAIEERRALVVLESATIDRERAIRLLSMERSRLAASWGSIVSDFTEVVGELESTTPITPFDAIQSFISRSPEVARWKDEMALRSASVSYARSMGIPNPVVTVGARRLGEINQNAVVASVSIPLPLFNRNQGRIRETLHRLKQGEEQQRAAAVAANTSLEASYQTLVGAYSEIKSLRDRVLPAARENFAATQEGYAEGKFDLLTVLDAQRTLFGMTNQYIDVLQIYHFARAEVERLIGTSLGDI